MTTTRMHVAVVDIGRLDHLGWAVEGAVNHGLMLGRD